MNFDLRDHPVVKNMERTGYPDGKEPIYPHCPVCGAECEDLYRNKNFNIVGCDVCIRITDAWEGLEWPSRKE